MVKDTQILYTAQALKGAQTSLNRLREGIKQHAFGNDSVEMEEIAQYKEQFKEAIIFGVIRNIPLPINF